MVPFDTRSASRPGCLWKNFMIDKSGDRIREMFGEIAGRYDLLNHLLSFQMDRYWRWRAVRRVPPRGDRPVLDVCTGTGDLAIAYRKAIGSDSSVIATDFCHQMLVIGRSKAGNSNGACSIEFVEADTLRLPFSDKSFQIVSVAFGLRNLAHTDRGLQEMKRVLLPGGKMVILEFSRPRWPVVRHVYRWYFHRVLPVVGRIVSRNCSGAYSYLPASVDEFPQGRMLVERMHQAGLVDVQVYPLTLGVASLYIGSKRQEF